MIFLVFINLGFADCQPCESRDCVEEYAQCLIDNNAAKEAIKALKVALEQNPGDGALVRRLYIAYQASGNKVWADRKLFEQVENYPEDFETRSWAIWGLIEEGDLTRARFLLDGVNPEGPLYARFKLLNIAADLFEDKEINPVDLNMKESVLYPEDLELLKVLRLKGLNDMGQPLSFKSQLSGGYTSNAVQSAPQDSGDTTELTGSPITQGEFIFRWEPWFSMNTRPLGELRLKGLFPTQEEVSSSGYADFSGRLGIEYGTHNKARLIYSYELLGVNSADTYSQSDTRLFMEAHRADVELDVEGAQIFLGGGRRIYREIARTRNEIDGGAASIRSFGNWNFTGIVTGRTQFARNIAWNEIGGTALGRIAWSLPKNWLIESRGTVSIDYYPESADYYEVLEPRRDLTFKAQIQPWSPVFKGFRAGLNYSFTKRNSTIGTIKDDFSFVDNRFLIELKWQGSVNPSYPATYDSSENRLELDYGLGTGSGGDLDRVQDLLRQEDSARRGSSCVD